MSSPIANAYREVASILEEHRDAVLKFSKELDEQGYQLDRAAPTEANGYLANESLRLGYEAFEIADRMSDDIDAIRLVAGLIENLNAPLEDIPPWANPPHGAQEAIRHRELFSPAVENAGT